MTVIAYKDGVLASDSRETAKEFIWTDKSPKIYKLSDGSLYAGSGDSTQIEYMKFLLEQEIKKNKKSGATNSLPTRVKGIRAILVATAGRVWYYEPNQWSKYTEKYIAIGSGAEAAFGALDMGATAVEAVRVGIKRNIHCGGKVQVLKLRKKK